MDEDDTLESQMKEIVLTLLMDQEGSLRTLFSLFQTFLGEAESILMTMKRLQSLVSQYIISYSNILRLWKPTTTTKKIIENWKYN